MWRRGGTGYTGKKIKDGAEGKRKSQRRFMDEVGHAESCCDRGGCWDRERWTHMIW